MNKSMLFVISGVMMLLCCSCGTLTGHYHLTEKDSGRTLYLNRGDQFTVTLDANPATGYLWQFGTPPYDENVMILRGDKYIHPSEQLAGAPGKRTLHFLAENSGRTGLRLILSRPWEKNIPPQKEFHLMILVKDGTEDDTPRGPRMRRNSKGELVPDRKRSIWE
ncbi:MAG: protease inhibitor I42 family protein [Lentisphaeria bacterium]|nr:protease inhibitor I42 family protein [Lentisphaeria bacterium]